MSENASALPAFIEAALSDKAGAERMLAAYPQLADEGLHAALVLGDVARVERMIGAAPALVGEKGGPRGWEPLLDVCFSQQRGASTEASALDRLLSAAGNAPPEAVGRLIANAGQVSIAPHDRRLLPDLTMSHAAGAVRALLDLGCRVDTGGEHGATALHWACWKGYSDLVALLVDRGAPLAIEDRQVHATPAGWFARGVQNCAEHGGDYPALARLLLDAGATLPAADLPTGNAAVDAVLRERRVIT
jgi:hypothetical protein